MVESLVGLKSERYNIIQSKLLYVITPFLQVQFICQSCEKCEVFQVRIKTCFSIHAGLNLFLHTKNSSATVTSWDYCYDML